MWCTLQRAMFTPIAVSWAVQSAQHTQSWVMLCDVSFVERCNSSAYPERKAVVSREFLRVYFCFCTYPGREREVERFNPAHAWAFIFIHLYKVSRSFYRVNAFFTYISFVTLYLCGRVANSFIRIDNNNEARKARYIFCASFDFYCLFCTVNTVIRARSLSASH